MCQLLKGINSSLLVAGIGNLFHCAPSIPHYSKNKAVGVMKPGHVFTIEPMINEGTWQDDTWPDDWTAVTADGKRSAQFEQTMVVTEDGIEVITARQEDSPSFQKQIAAMEAATAAGVAYDPAAAYGEKAAEAAALAAAKPVQPAAAAPAAAAANDLD